ncbi:XTP/dITP diphosphatase [Candidatus Micrarchaeota archaeon]|nr:XTP/dITP diphosphatase [Candidatus Micrarchaeota archaeon]
MELLFATGNQGKLGEAQEMLESLGHTVRQVEFSHRELRSDSLEEIARDSAEAAWLACGQPVFVEDSGLFIDSLNGFPGTFSAWVLEKIGTDGILRLMGDRDNRRAVFRTCIAFHDGKGVHTFSGECRGRISREQRGGGGFGYDPVFVPEGHEQTFAESITLKNKLSHRYKTLLDFSRYLQGK